VPVCDDYAIVLTVKRRHSTQYVMNMPIVHNITVKRRNSAFWKKLCKLFMKSSRHFKAIKDLTKYFIIKNQRGPHVEKAMKSKNIDKLFI
jgi:hypothetical protein